MSTTALPEVDANDRGSGCGGSARSIPQPGPALAGVASESCSKDASMTELQKHGSLLGADEATEMPPPSRVDTDSSALHVDTDGGQHLESMTCSGDGTDDTHDGSILTNGSEPMPGDSLRPAYSANMLSHSGEGNVVRAIALSATVPDVGARGMQSTEEQPSAKGSAGLKSFMESSMHADGGSASMSAVEAGSVSLANGSGVRAIRSQGAMEDDDGSGAEAQRADEDFTDVEAEEEDCRVATLPGLPPLDDQCLTDDEARLILGAQVRCSLC